MALRQSRESIAADQDRRLRLTEEDETTVPTFEPGQLVFVTTYFLSSAASGQTSKFYPRRDGPYLVTRRCSLTAYEVAAPDHPEIILGKYHVVDLTPFTTQNEEETPVRSIRTRGRPANARSTVSNEESTSPTTERERDHDNRQTNNQSRGENERTTTQSETPAPVRRGRGRPRRNPQLT